MRFLLAPTALALLAASPAPPAKPGPVCQDYALQRTDATQGRPTIHPLTQEPPAKQLLAVLRSVDGCSRPVVVREVVGAPARR